MNDRFKFKAFDKLSNEIIDITGFRIEDDMLTIYTSNGFRTRKLSEVDLIQSTGLKDKHGTLIFEGDIIQYAASPILSDTSPKIFTKVVYFEDGCFLAAREVGYTDPSYLFTCMHYKVIGNIHQHKHLLK